MNPASQILEARVAADVLRAKAKAIRGEEGATRYELLRAVDALDVMVTLARRCLTHVDALERLIRKAVDHDHEAFESGGQPDCGELLAWFAEWREDALTALDQLASTSNQGATSNALLVVNKGLDAEDLDLIAFALDLLDQHTSTKPGELLNKLEQAATMSVRSRLLIVQGKLRLMRDAL